jgi:hypothetical protein
VLRRAGGLAAGFAARGFAAGPFASASSGVESGAAAGADAAASGVAGFFGRGAGFFLEVVAFDSDDVGRSGFGSVRFLAGILSVELSCERIKA